MRFAPLKRGWIAMSVNRRSAASQLRPNCGCYVAQIHPHFLFNALTTIGYLIQTSPQRALRTLMRLSSLLRTVLRSGREISSLGEELDVVSAYLDIERARFEDRLSIEINVSSELRKLNIPSLLLQPLVENSIKHGIGKSSAGGQVRITASLTDLNSQSALRVVVEDTGNGADEIEFAIGRAQGVGLNSVEKRLLFYTQGHGVMNVRSSPGIGTCVEVLLPVETPSSLSNQQPLIAKGAGA
jgi:two-component system LytT family sensor kinase